VCKISQVIFGFDEIFGGVKALEGSQMRNQLDFGGDLAPLPSLPQFLPRNAFSIRFVRWQHSAEVMRSTK